MAHVYPINNYFLYTISHPDRYGAPIIDLSEDKEAEIASNITLTHAQTSIERVIVKAFTKYNIPLDITDKIRGAFKAKLWRMGKCLSKLGGTKRQQQLQKWKEDKDSVWSLTVDAVEATRQLMKRKQQVEELLGNEVAKRRRIESEVKTLKFEARTIKKVARKQADTLVRLRTGRSEGGRGTSSKTWSQYSRQHRCEKKKALSSNIQAALSFDEEHWKPVSVELENVETGSREILNIRDGTFSEARTSTIASEDEKLCLALYIKDKFSLSDEAYHEMSLSPVYTRSRMLQKT